MSTRDIAGKVLARLSEDELREFLNIFADDTMLAMAESDYQVEHPEEARTYTSFSEILAELEEEMAEEMANE